MNDTNELFSVLVTGQVLDIARKMWLAHANESERLEDVALTIDDFIPEAFETFMARHATVRSLLLKSAQT